MSAKRILITVAGLWVFLVVGGSLLGVLFGSDGSIGRLNAIFADETCTVTGFPVSNAATALDTALNGNDDASNVVLRGTIEIVQGLAPTVKYTSDGQNGGFRDGGLTSGRAGWAYPGYIDRYVAFTAASATTAGADLTCNGTVETATPPTANFAAGNVAVGDDTPTAFSQTNYADIGQALFGFVPLIVALGFLLPIFGAIGLGGYFAYSKVRAQREM